MDSLDKLFSNFEKNIANRGMTSEKCEKLLKSNKVIIMGAGNCGTVLLQRLNAVGIEVIAFIDNRGSVHGRQYCGIPICTSGELRLRLKKDESYLCIVALLDILSYENIKESLMKDFDGCLRIFYFTEFRAYRQVFGLDKNPSFSAYLGEDPQVLFKNKEHIISVYNLLADELSKKCYLELLNFYICTDFIKFTVLPFDDHYFAYDLYKKNDDEVFVDCGAYDGDTIDIFLKNQKEMYRRYFAIEADYANCGKIERKIVEQGIKDISVFQCYVADRKKAVKFMSEGTSYSRGEENSEGEVIETATLDELFYQEKPTFLKINIEGADADAIRGAKRIIEEYAPIIAVQGHHKIEHLWEIVEIVREFNAKEYYFFFRNYKGICEYTFYAIPRNRLAKQIEKQSAIIVDNEE